LGKREVGMTDKQFKKKIDGAEYQIVKEWKQDEKQRSKKSVQ